MSSLLDGLTMNPLIKLTRGGGGYWYRKRFFNLITVGRATYEFSMECDIDYLQTYGKFPVIGDVLYCKAELY